MGTRAEFASSGEDGGAYVERLDASGQDFTSTSRVCRLDSSRLLPVSYEPPDLGRSGVEAHWSGQGDLWRSWGSRACWRCR